MTCYLLSRRLSTSQELQILNLRLANLLQKAEKNEWLNLQGLIQKKNVIIGVPIETHTQTFFI